MNEFNGKNCVIYTRVSSKTQVSRGNGLQSQETCCKEWARNNEVNIISVFQDGGISGKYSSREGLDSMIAFLKSENKSYVKIHYVLVDDVDRIIRDVSGWREIKAKIEKSGGAQIHSLKQNIENTPEGNMMQSITMSVKQYERENNARRAVERKRARLMDGYRVSNCPNGYKFTGKGKNKSVVFTDSIHIIKDALEKYADGRFRSMVEFRYYIDDLGLRNANGNYYQKDFYFNLLRKERLLFYAGFVDVPSLGVNMVKGKHEAIISVETMERILKINEVKFRTRKFSDYDNYVRMPLRNTLFCECCNRPMSGGPSKNKKGDYYYYYRCFNKDCSQNESFNVNVVNSCFEEYLRNLTISDSVLECFKIAMISIYENKDNEIELMNERKKRSIEDITKRIDKLYEITISSDSEEIMKLYQQKLNGLLLEKKKLEGEIISKQKDETNIPELLEYTLPILQNPYKLWMKEDIEIRRLIAGVVIGGKILYNKKSGITTPDISSFYQTNLGFENGISAVSEDGGFEPPLPCSKHRFQRCAIDHSANLPDNCVSKLAGEYLMISIFLSRKIIISYNWAVVFTIFDLLCQIIIVSFIYVYLHGFIPCMKLRELLLAGTLILTPTYSNEDSIRLNIQKDLNEILTKEKTEESESPVFYKFDLSTEVLKNLDSLDIRSGKKIIFTRQLTDLRNTPLFMKGVRRNIGEFLGYNQSDSIIKKYNNDSLSVKSVNDIQSVSFPLIYDNLHDKIPQNLDSLLSQDKFIEYKDKLNGTDSLIVVSTQDDGKYTISYYIDGKLFLASHASIGMGKSTPQGLFDIKRKIFDKRSIKYENAPMPYALHLDGNIFIHQGYIDGRKKSHGCVRVPGLYQEILFYSAKVGTKVLIVS